jgi:NADPH:quinone reductase-like Zn-dependent oxidoreductase
MSDKQANEQLKEIADLIARGLVRTPSQQMFPLQEAGTAHALLEAGGVRGKLILQVADL